MISRSNSSAPASVSIIIFSERLIEVITDLNLIFDNESYVMILHGIIGFIVIYVIIFIYRYIKSENFSLKHELNSVLYDYTLPCFNFLLMLILGSIINYILNDGFDTFWENFELVLMLKILFNAFRHP